MHLRLVRLRPQPGRLDHVLDAVLAPRDRRPLPAADGEALDPLAVDDEDVVLGHAGGRLLPERTSPLNRPWVLSYWSRYARLSAGTRSLTATTSSSVPSNPCSTRARNTSRPIRPNPLIPIFTAAIAVALQGTRPAGGAPRPSRQLTGTAAVFRTPSAGDVVDTAGRRPRTRRRPAVPHLPAPRRRGFRTSSRRLSGQLPRRRASRPSPSSTRSPATRRRPARVGGRDRLSAGNRGRVAVTGASGGRRQVDATRPMFLATPGARVRPGRPERVRALDTTNSRSASSRCTALRPGTSTRNGRTRRVRRTGHRVASRQGPVRRADKVAATPRPGLPRVAGPRARRYRSKTASRSAPRCSRSRPCGSTGRRPGRVHDRGVGLMDGSTVLDMTDCGFRRDARRRGGRRAQGPVTGPRRRRRQD